MKIVGYGKLTRQQKLLIDEAELAMANSYSPYSNFSVGAALLAMDGTMIAGTNVENAVYGETVCAERTAITRANAMGHRTFRAMAIITKGGAKGVIGPCGPCRQVIYEFSEISGIDLEILVSTTRKDKILVAKISELLPFPFGPGHLGVDIKKYKKQNQA